MVNAIMVLSGYVGCIVFILLWRLAISNKKRAQEDLAVTRKLVIGLNAKNYILEERIKQEVLRYDKLIQHQAQTQSAIDSVDDATPAELLDLMQNNSGSSGSGSNPIGKSTKRPSIS